MTFFYKSISIIKNRSRQAQKKLLSDPLELDYENSSKIGGNRENGGLNNNCYCSIISPKIVYMCLLCIMFYCFRIMI